MTVENREEALQSALNAARENENRWMKMSAELCTDSDRTEWVGVARLRRLEVERIEALIAAS